MLVYHGTRLVAYTTLGSVAGLSSAVILRSALQAFAPPLGIALGAVMLAYATVELALALRARREGHEGPPRERALWQ